MNCALSRRGPSLRDGRARKIHNRINVLERPRIQRASANIPADVGAWPAPDAHHGNAVIA
jgi:hypothetical protein